MISAKDLLSKARGAQREFRDGVQAQRRRIAELQSERGKIVGAPPLEEIAHKRVDDWIAGLAVMPRGATPAPERFMVGPTQYLAPRWAERSDVLFSYLAGVLADALKAEISARYAGRPGLTEDERRRELDRLDRDLLDAEYAEESLLRAAEAAGFTIQRRPDQDPRAALASDEALP